MASIGKITRRTLLVGAVAVAGGVAFGYYQYRKPYPNPLTAGEGEAVFNPYVKIASDETITIIAPRAEMGQGIMTTLAALVAEELDVSLDKVTVEHGPASYAYYNEAMLAEGGPFPSFNESFVAETVRDISGAAAKILGIQGTGGSSSTRDAFEKMRLAGATARETLMQAAAKRLNVSVTELQTENGTVTHPASGQSLTYGELATDAATIDPPAEVQLRDPAEWKLLGKSQPRVDMHAKVIGAPVFSIDVEEPDMLYGTVKMSPRFGAKPKSSDLSAAEAMPGVVKIVPIDTDYGHGFGIIAENTWAAFNAANAIKVEWGAADYPLDDAGITARLNAALDAREGGSLRDDGDVDTAFADAPAERIVEANYSVPYLAHTTMEPMNATARLKDGVLDVWTGDQMPTVTRQLCAHFAGVEEDKTNIHTTMMGGGFGRRGEMDFSIYAAILAKETDGRPVKVTWTREEDTRHDAYRPTAAGRFKARLGEDGIPVAVDMNIATPSIIKSVLRRTFPSLSPAGPDRLLSEGAFDQPYTIGDYRVTGSEADISIPVGFWRSVGNSFNAYFHESFMDEIATKGGVDPFDMRMKLMGDYPVAVEVLKKLAEISDWSNPPAAGRARGMAFTLSFGAWVGQVIEVSEGDDGIRIEKVWCVADLGTVLDPSIVEAQMLSGIVYGLSSAMEQEITFSDGMVEQSNFYDYGAMRMSQCPEFEIVLLENSETLGGAGEPGTPPSIPALANAVFALTGKRIRAMPLSKEVDFV